MEKLPEIPLSSLLFFHELPDVTGYSFPYVRRLVTPPRTEASREYADAGFPKPRVVTPAGVRAWAVDDVEAWFYARRAQRALDLSSVWASRGRARGHASSG